MRYWRVFAVLLMRRRSFKCFRLSTLRSDYR